MDDIEEREKLTRRREHAMNELNREREREEAEPPESESQPVDEPAEP